MKECFWYNEEMELDKSLYPEKIQKIMVKLEKLYEEDDWLNYDGGMSELEVTAKALLLNKVITEKQWDMLLRKYCGYL